MNVVTFDPRHMEYEDRDRRRRAQAADREPARRTSRSRALSILTDQDRTGLERRTPAA